MIVKTFIWKDEIATQTFAERLAQYWLQNVAGADMLVFLHGDLGAGKTTFTRYLLRALGVQGRIKSPTFAVVEPYQVPYFAIAHCDFYRFDSPREYEDSGLRDVFAGTGLKLVEWPQKAEGLLPMPDWDMYLQQVDAESNTDVADDAIQARQVRIEAHSPNGEAALQHMAQC